MASDRSSAGHAATYLHELGLLEGHQLQLWGGNRAKHREELQGRTGCVGWGGVFFLLGGGGGGGRLWRRGGAYGIGGRVAGQEGGGRRESMRPHHHALRPQGINQLHGKLLQTIRARNQFRTWPCRSQSRGTQKSITLTRPVPAHMPRPPALPHSPLQGTQAQSRR